MQSRCKRAAVPRGARAERKLTKVAKEKMNLEDKEEGGKREQERKGLNKPGMWKE